MPRLTTDTPEGLHLLSLLLRAQLEASLATPAGKARARKISKGSVGLVAGEMETRLVFTGDRIHLDQAPLEGVSARAAGNLAAFTHFCLGRLRAADLLLGHVRVSGRLTLLRQVLPLLQRPDAS